MPENLRVDHVSLGSKDLDASALWLEKTAGLVCDESWWFPSGLCNRIAYSGAAAVELLGVGFPGAEMVSPLVGQVHARTTAGDRWLAWCVATDDIDATARRLGLDVMEGSAVTLAGQRISWRMAGALEAFFSEPFLPFFISYDDDGWRTRALRDEPAFDVVTIALSGDRTRLDDWLGGAELPVDLTPGPADVLGVVIGTASGAIDLRPVGR